MEKLSLKSFSRFASNDPHVEFEENLIGLISVKRRGYQCSVSTHAFVQFLESLTDILYMFIHPITFLHPRLKTSSQKSPSDNIYHLGSRTAF